MYIYVCFEYLIISTEIYSRIFSWKIFIRDVGIRQLLSRAIFGKYRRYISIVAFFKRRKSISSICDEIREQKLYLPHARNDSR